MEYFAQVIDTSADINQCNPVDLKYSGRCSGEVKKDSCIVVDTDANLDQSAHRLQFTEQFTAESMAHKVQVNEI